MKYTNFSMDGESNGPSPRRHSLVWFGVVLINEVLDTHFEGKMCPISREYVPDAIKVTGLTHEETLLFPSPLIVMPAFIAWVKLHTKPGTKAMLWSDNNGYDMSFFSPYLHEFAGVNPFRHTSRNISDRYKGLMAGRKAAGTIDPPDEYRSFEHLIITPHDHTPVNDARGNAQALLGMRKYGLEIDV
jgi:hypothetical protein